MTGLARARRRAPRAAAGLSMLIAAALAGCGSGETTFTAQEFVERANDEGAGLELADRLSSASGAAEVWSVRLSGGDPGGPSPSPPASGAGSSLGADLAHGGGSLAVSEDAEAGAAEYDRCEQAVTLTCFRAANVVLRLEGGTPDEVARIEDALRAMESG
jgi:hypothetical protein